MRKEFKTERLLAFALAIMMLVTSIPLQAIAAQLNYDDIGGQKSTYINNIDPVTPGKAQNAKDYLKEPEMPEIYTLHSDYLVQKDHKWRVNYQPYVASVGANATPKEQDKVKKTINLPDLKGYEKPQDSFDITYDSIVAAAKTGEKTGDTWQKDQEFKYDAKESAFYVKHVFQSLTNFNEYGKKDGETGDHFGLVTGRTGSILDIQPLDDNLIEGFTPEADKLTSMVPENTRGFQVEYRYNRNSYEIDYDTVDGSDIDSRLLYYGQVIPKVEVPTKKGSIFLGWKPSVELKGKVNNIDKTFAANEIIKDNAGNVIKDLDANLIVPAKNVVFKADWKDAPKADYLIQFWTEKPDYDDKDDTLSLRERYDYIGSRRIEDADTGSRPDLTNLSIKGITFPDLNGGRLQKAQNDPKEFARYYFLNEKLTEKQNASKENPSVQKSVLSTGETVYNVYYNRRVYTLYFTSINNEYDDYAYWPIITKDGQELGKEGAPYKVDVRFNQSLDKIWPKDEEISGLPKGDSTEPTGDDGLIGWMINHNNNDNGVSIFRDTPPYRLSAEDFIDAKDVMSTEDESGGKGHADKIPIGKNKEKDRGEYEISLGASYIDTAIAYHIDIIKDDFEGKEQIDYDMTYWKSDTNTYDYEFILPHLQGFTLKKETRPAQLIGKIKVGDVEKTFDELNAERNKKTPFRSDDDKIEYISHFPWSQKLFDGTNAYDYASYTRNKYKLKLNNDPKAIKNDSEYTDGKDRFDVYYEMPLNNLQLDTNNVPKKPDWVPDNWEFKGWATDPAGENLLKDGKETKLHYDQFLFAKWGEPDAKWKVTIDPDGGTMKNITVEDLIFRRSEDHNVNKSAVKEANEGNKQIFTVNHKEKLNKVQKPKRKGYDFLGWQVIRHNKDGSVDTSYRKTYGVPELYAFGNEVVGEVYIKAIWLANNKIDVPVYHHFIDKDGNEIIKPRKFVIEDARAKYYTAATATEQNQDWILMPHEELMDLPDENKVKQNYIKYNEHHKFDNTDIHSLKVEPQFILGEDGNSKPNQKAEFNEFHFYYRRFKTRDYKVNYLDKKAQAEIKKIIEGTDTLEKKKAAIKAIVEVNSIIPQEEVVSRNRHYDARNYRRIPGWKLASDPQQQLFYDVEEDTGEFKGINGTGLDEIFFYYEDVRVIDVPKDDPVPEGYVRVTFKADNGGAFTDKDGNSKTELYYDVIKGLKSDLLVVPQELKDGTVKEEGKYNITPDNGKTFKKWDEKPLLNDNTIIEREYTFTAYFDWEGLSATGLVRTEAFKDPNGKWTNDFAPTIDQLKKQLEWREKDQVKPLPTGTEIKFVYVDDANVEHELNNDEDVYNLVNEKKAADKDELVRTVNIKAKVKFKDKKDIQELNIPIKVYKNVYEALTTGEKPLFLSEAEKGDLRDVTGKYVMVTVAPTGELRNKDNKVYYVNKNAWVEIPELQADGTSFINWTADKEAQNENQEANGKFDFTKRHKFTEVTVISPRFSQTNELTVHESYKDGDTWVNDFITSELTEKKLKEAVQVKDAKGNAMALGAEDKIAIVDDAGKVYANDDALKAALYDKLQEKDNDGKPSRIEKIKVKVSFKDGTSQIVEIPVKVIKNIYEAKTLTEKPYYVPDGYVKVTVDPTTKATDPQKTYYYVNPDAKVVIPGKDPTGVDPNKFIKWIIDGTDTEYKLSENPRHQFVRDTTIKAIYSEDVIPQEGNDKPDGVPDYFVKVTFVETDNGTLDGAKVYWVNSKVAVSIPVAKPVGKQYFTFKEWKMGADASGAVYNPKTPTMFTNPETIITATYDEAKNIIPYDPSDTDPMQRPDGYVRVSFAAQEGITLTENKAYYVKKNAGILLGDKELVKPNLAVKTGYKNDKSKEWDKDDTLEIKDKDVVVIATATHLDPVIPQKYINGSDKPTGYVTVTFVADKNGEIRDKNDTKIDKKVYYVNPNEYVRLDAPKPVGNTGYDFVAWSKENVQGEFSIENFIKYTEDTTIKAMFNKKDDVYPKLKDDESDKPAGYVKVTFEIIGNLGKFADKEVTTYYVNPDKLVSLKAPKTVDGTGYIFDGWRFEPNTTAEKIDPADRKQYKEDTIIYGSFKELDDIIPATNGNGSANMQPVDYVVVLFVGGEHANKVDGQVKYFVNPKAGKKIKDLQKPKITPDTGWRHTGWDKDDETEIKGYMFVIAKYEAIKPVIPALKEDGTPNDKPDGYVKVTFKAGQNGKIKDKNGNPIAELVYYVNPNEYVQLDAPETEGNTDYKFGSWSSDDKFFSLDNFIRYEKDTTITANFNPKKDVIPKTKPDESEKLDGYVTVNFVLEQKDGKDAGKIKAGETITYFVAPNKLVTIDPPDIDVYIGYTFVEWKPDTTKARQYGADTTVKGTFEKLDDIINTKNPDGTVNPKPKGYATVRFLKGDHGVLDGQTTFYVNPNAGKRLEDLNPGAINIVPDYTFYFDSWDMPLTTTITTNLVVTAKYQQHPDIIKAGPADTAPAGYVVIIFETDGNGTITGNIEYEKDKTNPAKNETEIVYFVNPKKGIKLANLEEGGAPTDKQLAVPSTTPNDKYQFEKWHIAIDADTPITRGRVHIAIFKPKEVKLTYDANGATEGTLPPVLTVDYGTSVRLAHQGDLKKKDASFKGWKIGTKIYQAGYEITLEENTTAIAQWTTDDTIIKYDPNATDPMPRPDDTYARVTFAVDNGLELKEFKAYYVKKDAGKKLGDTELVKPGYSEEIGYKFDKWDKKDNLEITRDVLVTAKAIKLDTAIPETKEDGTPNDKPTGYKEVVFKVEDANKGMLEGVTKFYVNPTEYVTINPPTAKAKTGYEFGGWNKDATRPTVYKEDLTTITASFNDLKAVIPKTNPDGTENKKPADYKTVTFVIEGRGGDIRAGEVKVYYVNPEEEVKVPQPKTLADTGYEFVMWDKDTTTDKKYTEDTTVKGNFKKLDDIIPSTDGTGQANAKPDGYVKVTFDKGEHGKEIKGQTVYYVNPKAGIKLGNLDIAKPTVTAETGYKFTKWDRNDTEEIKDNITVTAQYEELLDVIEKDNPQGGENKKPEGYITVTFSTEANGKIKDTADTKTKLVYLNPNKAHVLRPYAPDVTPNTGYDFADWDTPIDKKIQYDDGDVIKALYNIKGDVIPQEKTDGSDKPEGYLTVTFVKGDHGELEGKTVYYVNPNKEVTVPAPKVNASVGYKFRDWNEELTQTFTAINTIITAQYDPLEDIIAQEKTDESDKPFGYITVTFKADANGSLEGETVYYVNPDKTVDLRDAANAITKKANLGYTAEGGTWDKALNAKFNDGDVITFNFKELLDVIEKTKNDESERPEGYVKVTLKPTDKATDETKAEKVYFVNPKKLVTIINKPVGKKETINEIEYTYTFTGWTVTRGTIASWTDENINGQFTQETEITAKYSTKVDMGEVLPSPVPKKDAVTAKGDTPNAEDLIKNIPGSENNPLPEGTEINYTDDGKPDVNNPGKTTAKVEVKYPNGKTVVVEVPLTVVDHVVPQIGGEDVEKPLVPDSYVKVTVDTTDKATDNTKFKKVFWVKPSVEVTIPGIQAPTGKPETDADGVTNTNNFKKWKLLGSNSEKFYENEITDTFTAKESTILATYEQDKNVEPQAKDDQWIPQGHTPDPKDFINNPYNDSDPNNKDNLPPGTKFEFVPGAEPDTSNPGEKKQTKIKVTYPNGEVKEVPVIYNVSGDVVEQTDPNKKPDVPDNFVKVVVDTTDFAKGDSYYVKTYWVNPENIVTIPATIPKDIREGYAFDYWQVDLGRENGTRYRKVIEDRFVRPTYIKACYYKVEVPKPGSDYVVTDVNVFPNEDEYRSKITPPKGKDIDYVRIIAQPDVSKPGNRTQAEVKVFYKDGTSATVTVKVYVQRPGETNTRIVYRDRIVEKEKIVEKIVKIKDNQRLKEVRFMQGFEGKFRPHDGLTRAEAAQILANALKQDGYKYNPAYPINYKDVKQKWYTQAIVITTQANVFKGYDDGYFRPEEKISRAEWIATLKRFQQLKDADGNRMGLKANHWATREVEAAYEEGWLQIYTNGNAKFNANEPITREEVAAVTNKAFGRLIDRTYIMRNDKSVINYKDINSSMWSYVDILCASNSFIRDENFYMSHGIEYINSMTNSIEGTIIFNVQLKNLEIIQDKFQRYLR